MYFAVKCTFNYFNRALIAVITRRRIWFVLQTVGRHLQTTEGRLAAEH